MQNEWRIMAYAEDVLIEEDCWIPDIKPFQYAVQMQMESPMVALYFACCNDALREVP